MKSTGRRVAIVEGYSSPGWRVFSSPERIEPLPVTPEHALALTRLRDHHKDPFDRILLAQAITEPLYFLTADRALSVYSDLVLTV